MLEVFSASGALLLAAAGVLLICVEFCLPGWVAPGVTGGVMLVCGLHRLLQLEASVAGLGLLVCSFALAAMSGYGWMPVWAGWAGIALSPVAAYSMSPDAVHWAAALACVIPTSAVFTLLRVAAQAVANKTIMD